MEDTLEKVIYQLQSLGGAPATTLTLLVCIGVGYLFKSIKQFPNGAIPMVVILTGAFFYPLIADDRNNMQLRVWIVRNGGLGLVLGVAAWLVHYLVISRIEDKLVEVLGKWFGMFQAKNSENTDNK